MAGHRTLDSKLDIDSADAMMENRAPVPHASVEI